MINRMQIVDVYEMRVIEDANALEATKERLFPESKNRSARIRKKLIKRFGGEFRMQPCAWRVGDAIVAHPMIIANLRAKMIQERDCTEFGAFYP